MQTLLAGVLAFPKLHATHRLYGHTPRNRAPKTALLQCSADPEQITSAGFGLCDIPILPISVTPDHAMT